MCTSPHWRAALVPLLALTLACGTEPTGDQTPTAAAPAQEAPRADATWRSELYPTNWTPEYTHPQGHFFHDVSYAGYRNSEGGLGQAIPNYTLDVITVGADNTGATDVTAAVNYAISIVADGGGVVYFPPGYYRFDGSITISSSNVVLRGAGPTQSRLFFTQSVGMSNRGHITFKGNISSNLETLLVNDGQSRSTWVDVADTSQLAVGDDIAIGWVITEAFVQEHGMEDYWPAFRDTWQPFFWREIMQIDTSTTPHRVRVDVPLRYPSKVRDFASVRRYKGYVRECGIEDMGLANAVAWSEAWAQTQVHVLEMTGVKDCWVQRVESFDPPTGPTSGYGKEDHLQSGGILVKLAKRVTIADSIMQEAEHRGDGGNGYLFEIRQANEILTRDCQGLYGRHNFIQNWGFGTTGCVWQRVYSRGGRAVQSEQFPYGYFGYSEFHHSLATANLIDSSSFDDGWSIQNRRDWSTGAGHTGTETVIWNTGGRGLLQSYQYKWGYVIGTGPNVTERIKLRDPGAQGTAPEDWSEGLGDGASLQPQSLFDDMLTKRLAR